MHLVAGAARPASPRSLHTTRQSTMFIVCRRRQQTDEFTAQKKMYSRKATELPGSNSHRVEIYFIALHWTHKVLEATTHERSAVPPPAKSSELETQRICVISLSARQNFIGHTISEARSPTNCLFKVEGLRPDLKPTTSCGLGADYGGCHHYDDSVLNRQLNMNGLSSNYSVNSPMITIARHL
ncbi:hypothetical protein EVAR_7211_1 [Eumeta japonica]|uniref:Uncharacterized protein n=1 Tax=Eumeta variegata TaxID=151549 RepID=A0A4C1T2A3_EUMVA|nr:hypothetical protein EVAR_7211_1 [Eumeta japonica]